jgi:hypothetical protein
MEEFIAVTLDTGPHLVGRISPRYRGINDHIAHVI